jgi:hypothetical protein
VDHAVELVAMDDEIAPPVGALVDGAVDDLDAAEMRALEVAQEFVVIARDIGDPRPLARHAQQLLDHVVVRLGPVPGPFSRQPSTMSPTR